MHLATNKSDKAPRVLTIGHSNHSLERFMELLGMHGVEVVVDTRSNPWSKYAAHFDKESLKESLRRAGLKYLFLGQELGGRPADDSFYDAEGHVLYDRVAKSKAFEEGISRVKQGVDKFVVALLCAEENPESCHRRLLVGRVLSSHGVSVCHIRGDGRLQSENELSIELKEREKQLSLLNEDSTWKSIPSVLRKRRQSNSSRL
ncbi:MAG TPA: DUF488 domain-containing protein [Candidatus Acidoferrales bacterium]|nr:DUF488 domain-containing protein [Candidatus Acidoferrales bacterium]